MFSRTGELDKPVPKEQPPPETLRQQDRSEQQNSGERCASIGRRDSDLRQKDRGGIMVWAVLPMRHRMPVVSTQMICRSTRRRLR